MTPQQIDAATAFQDAINTRWGNAPTRPHPKVEGFLDRPMSAFATFCGEAAMASRADHSPRPAVAVMGQGIGTSDFKNALASGARRLAAIRYQQFGEHLAFCADQEIDSFQTINFPGVDVGLDLDKEGDGAEIKGVRVIEVAGQTQQLTSYAKILRVSRNAIINDDIGVMGNFFSAIGSAAGYNEAKIISAMLEANPTLADGAAMFGASNTVASALSAANLDLAMKALRQQPTAAGNVANLRAFGLIVAPGLELTARTILKLAGLEAMPVGCLPGLADGRWYLLADPKVAPVIGRLILRGTKEPIVVGQLKGQSQFDGVVLKAIADLGIVALGRVGIVRGGA
jgi:hypothetical protein